MRQGQKSSDRQTYISEALDSVTSHRRKLPILKRLKLMIEKKDQPINWID